MPQVAYLLIYGELPSSRELARWDEALMRHSAVPDAVERAVAALPHDAHFMGIVLTAINALSTVHPEQNPALAGQNIYKSREIQDKQIVRLIGALSSSCIVSPGGPFLSFCAWKSAPRPHVVVHTEPSAGSAGHLQEPRDAGQADCAPHRRAPHKSPLAVQSSLFLGHVIASTPRRSSVLLY